MDHSFGNPPDEKSCDAYGGSMLDLECKTTKVCRFPFSRGLLLEGVLME